MEAGGRIDGETSDGAAGAFETGAAVGPGDGREVEEGGGESRDFERGFGRVERRRDLEGGRGSEDGGSGFELGLE